MATTELKGYTARKVAIHLIEKYVRRGDTIKSLREGEMGSGSAAGPLQYNVSIGGYINGKRVGPDWIVVTTLNGRPYHTKFKLEDIYKSIRRGATSGF